MRKFQVGDRLELNEEGRDHMLPIKGDVIGARAKIQESLESRDMPGWVLLDRRLGGRAEWSLDHLTWIDCASRDIRSLYAGHP